MATFSTRFLGCKVSFADAQAIRERLLADGHAEADVGDVAVVNTCCVTHEAVSKSRQAVSRAAREHGRVYVTGCGANLASDGFAGLPENVVVVSRRSEKTPAFVAGDVGAIGCVQADARLDRFLTTIGRRKFLMPLYQAMVDVGEVERARVLYAMARPKYHPIAVESIDRLLGVPGGE